MWDVLVEEQLINVKAELYISFPLAGAILELNKDERLFSF